MVTRDEFCHEMNEVQWVFFDWLWYKEDLGDSIHLLDVSVGSICQEESWW